MKIGFNHQKYLKMQSMHIQQRIEQFGNKLYLEFGGKLFDDYHASRVLPGFQPDSKLKMLMQLKDQAEIIIVISANDIERHKVRGDLGITYDKDVLRLKEAFTQEGLYVGSIVITQYRGQKAADYFKQQLEQAGIKVYIHYIIDGYPADVQHVVSEEGFGKNDYIETIRPLVVVTAPGPGSGKMATCLSQLYHEHRRGIKAGYAKFETFPIWNLPLGHPVNLAYEAATADLNDINMIDPFHLEAYGKTAINYNRDIEIFPVLKTVFEAINGTCPYQSPTDMGVNMVGLCIEDDDICKEASKQEIIRRYYQAIRKAMENDTSGQEEMYKLDLIMKKAQITKKDRRVVPVVEKLEQERHVPCAAIELPDGRIITAKTGQLLGACAALILNAVKALADIDHERHLIAPSAIEPIQHLKTDYLGSKNPRLHSDEVLIALSTSSSQDPQALLALQQLPKLKSCQAHASVALSSVDIKTFQKLGIDLTFEPLIKTKLNTK